MNSHEREIREAATAIVVALNNHNIMSYAEIARRLGGKYTYEIIRNFARGKSGTRENSTVFTDIYNLLCNLAIMADYYKYIDKEPIVASCIDKILHKTTPITIEAKLFEEWYDVKHKDVERVITIYAGTYVCFRKAFQKNKISISLLKITRSRNDNKICFFKEEERIMNRVSLNTKGYVLPIKDRLYLIGRADTTRVIKVMIVFDLFKIGRADFMTGVMTTTKDQGGEIFSTKFLAIPVKGEGTEIPVGHYNLQEIKSGNHLPKDFLNNYLSHIEDAIRLTEEESPDGVMRMDADDIYDLR